MGIYTKHLIHICQNTITFNIYYTCYYQMCAGYKNAHQIGHICFICQRFYVLYNRCIDIYVQQGELCTYLTHILNEYDCHILYIAYTADMLLGHVGLMFWHIDIKTQLTTADISSAVAKYVPEINMHPNLVYMLVIHCFLNLYIGF